MTLRTCLDCGLEAKTEDDLDLFLTHPNMKYNKANCCKECHNKRMKIIRKKPNIIKSVRVSRKKYREKIRIKALKSISNPPTCLHCGENDVRILVYDHIYDNGADDRHLNGIMLALKILNMSEEERLNEYQILCRNHNWLKQIQKYDRALYERHEI